ncbi:MAG: TetR/AcrR family transcriptional regulator [Solirubrobacterales bacterium]
MTTTAETEFNQAAEFLADDSVRGRLMLAMAQSITEKGFGQTVVADVVRIARVSRRTFYEHFDDREDCFLALCDAFTAKAREVIDAAADPALPWQEQARAGVEAHTALLMANPPLTRSFFFEIYSTGERGAQQHRKIHRLFAEQLCSLSEQIRIDSPDLPELTFPLASAMVAAIGELAMLAMEKGSTPEASDELSAVAFELISRVFAPVTA